MEKSSKIYVAGHKGLVGSAIIRRLQSGGYENVIVRTHDELDLLDQSAVKGFFEQEKPEYVFLAAARVGGILANNRYPASFIYENLQIQNNITHQAYVNKVRKLLFLGSSCVYPKNCSQPIKEEYLLTGSLEATNEPYAIAKIAGIKMCQSYNRQYGTNFIAAMPTNLYGPHDSFDLERAHVLPALIRKFHEAKEADKGEVEVWGTGKPKRELLHVDDMADGCLFLMKNFNPSVEQNTVGDVFVNLGTGSEISIKDLVELVRGIVGFRGEIVWNTSKPDGTQQKLQDMTKMHKLGWKHVIELESGIKDTYQWFLKNTSGETF